MINLDRRWLAFLLGLFFALTATSTLGQESESNTPFRTYESEAQDIGDGYELKFVEEGGIRKVLVKFPEKCLNTGKVVFFGCLKKTIDQIFDEPSTLKVGEDDNGEFAYVTIFSSEYGWADIQIGVVKDSGRAVGVFFTPVVKNKRQTRDTKSVPIGELY